MRNLDRLAAETAQCIVKETATFGKSQVENLATKALGVLQENGVYAAALFLYSRSVSDEKIALSMRRSLFGLAAAEIVKKTQPEDRAEKALSFVIDHISGDLEILLLVKQVWEQTLIYVRYGAKAREGAQ